MSLLKYWVWLSSLPRVRFETKNALIKHFGDPEAIFFSNVEELRTLVHPSEIEHFLNPGLQKAEYILDQCAELDVSILTLQDASYPVRLGNIFDPPPVLYVKGRLPVLDEEVCIAIVGTRRCSPYGLKMGVRFGYEITKGGGLIVSGLADGIDTAGAHGALRAGGSCIGVLGCAIDEIYPKNNSKLFEDVKSVGALISEYYPGHPMMPGNFPRRNRIISGISAGVVVIEAPKRSGALITANMALDHGRELFIVPGNIDAPASFGSNELMKNFGKPITCGWDVLCEYQRIYPSKIINTDEPKLKIPQQENALNNNTQSLKNPADIDFKSDETGEGFVTPRQPVTKKVIDKADANAYIDFEKVLHGLTDIQLKIIGAMDTPSIHVDDIIEKSGLPASSVLAELTIMEISGVVVQQGGKKFSVNAASR